MVVRKVLVIKEQLPILLLTTPLLLILDFKQADTRPLGAGQGKGTLKHIMAVLGSPLGAGSDLRGERAAAQQ